MATIEANYTGANCELDSSGTRRLRDSLLTLLFKPSDAPTPGVAAAPAATGTATKPAQVAIAPVIGPPEAVSKDLMAQLTSDIEAKNIRVAKAPNEKADYTLRGYVVSSMDKKGSRRRSPTSGT